MNCDIRHSMDSTSRRERTQRRLNKGWGDEVGAAAEWVAENQHLFQKEVFGPIGVLLVCRDPKYLGVVEDLAWRSLIVSGTRSLNNTRKLRCFTQTFVAQTQHDKELLERHLEPPPERLGWSLRIPVWFEEFPDIRPSPLSREKVFFSTNNSFVIIDHLSYSSLSWVSRDTFRIAFHTQRKSTTM